ncbi:MAG: hypothetical protein DSY60_04605, partial [Persephonella sp.]
EEIKVKKVSIKKSNKVLKKKVSDSVSFIRTIKVGDLVKHKKYGKGVVVKLNSPLATVLFEGVGEKRINVDFLEII